MKNTNATAFLRAIWADHSSASLRNFNPAVDLTNSSFSPVIPASTAVVSVDRAFVTRQVGVNTSTGVYAVPGKTFRVTRTDKGSSTVRVFVNMIRWGANHALEGEKYDRPMHLWGNAVPLKAGESQTLTHADGGIVFVNLEPTDTAETVSLHFTDVGSHPVFRQDSNSNFAASLTTTPFGWSELLTPGVEVHSTTEKMKKSVESYGGDAAQLASDTWTYVYKTIYNLAGFVGTDLSHSATITAFCNTKGWDCENTKAHALLGIQHFNADQANCGFLCSGNPVDSWAPFIPSGWGESHEVGHNLQYGQFKIYDGLSGEVSNNIFPTYVWLQWNKAHPNDRKGRSLMQKETFELLQTGQTQSSPSDYVKSKLWSESDGTLFWGRLNFYWQAALTSSDVTSLGDGGWDLYRLMYLHARLTNAAQGSDSTWAAERSKLGFSIAGFADRKVEISSNDHFLVAMSFITGRDQRPFFDMWGITYSSAAGDQVSAYNLPTAAKRFFVVPCEEKAFGAPLDAAYSVDGKTAWPSEGNCTK